MGKSIQKRKRQETKPKPTPEQLGLTNIKKRGRPRKIRPADLSAGIQIEEDSGNLDAKETVTVEKILEREEDLKKSFGFSKIADSVEEQPPVAPNRHDEYQKEFEEGDVIDDSTAGSLVIKDASGFPLETTSAMSLDKRSLEQTSSVRNTMFDMDPDDCVELNKSQNST